jgi:hypothetical protein
MSTVNALSNLAKDTFGPDLAVRTTPILVVVIAFVMIAAIRLFSQVGEAIGHAVELFRIALRALGTAALLLGVVVVMVVVAFYA